MTYHFNPGDRVEVISGKYTGRKGAFKKYGSVVFPDMCRVILDLRPRQKVQETVFIELKEIKPI